MPGVIEIVRKVPLAVAIEELQIIVECSQPAGTITGTESR
jgi:hypothetical protein